MKIVKHTPPSAQKIRKAVNAAFLNERNAMDRARLMHKRRGLPLSSQPAGRPY